jgi:hypothetical protein
MNSIQETECADKVVKYLASSMWENSAWQTEDSGSIRERIWQKRLESLFGVFLKSYTNAKLGPL